MKSYIDHGCNQFKSSKTNILRPPKEDKLKNMIQDNMPIKQTILLFLPTLIHSFPLY